MSSLENINDPDFLLTRERTLQEIGNNTPLLQAVNSPSLLGQRIVDLVLEYLCPCIFGH